MFDILYNAKGEAHGVKGELARVIWGSESTPDGLKEFVADLNSREVPEEELMELCREFITT